MVDFWNTIGRAAGNSKFRKALLAELKPQDYPTNEGDRSFVFTPAQYQTASKAVTDAISAAGYSRYPLSLMTLGELLYATSDATAIGEFEKAAAAVETSLGGYTSTDSLFYTALGAALVDDSVRIAIVGGGASAVGFGALSTTDKAKLQAVCAVPAFVTHSRAYCFELWNPDCFVKMSFYGGHEHPATQQALGGPMGVIEPMAKQASTT